MEFFDDTLYKFECLQIPIVPVPNTTTVKTTTLYSFLYKNRIIKIPEGFVSDGASIPRIFWMFLYSQFNPKILTGAVIHDFLYREGQINRMAADKLARKIWKLHGVGNFRAELMYYALRLLGVKAYNINS